MSSAQTIDEVSQSVPPALTWLEALRHYNDTSRVESIERIADDAYGVTLTDGYRFALFDVTTRTLTWHSPESGDTFECRRIG